MDIRVETLGRRWEERDEPEVREAREVARARASLLGDVASGLVHELRNPLAYVSANHQLLQQDLEWLLQRADDEECRARLVELQELTADCRTGTAKLTSILDGLSKMSPRAQGATQAGEVLDGVLKILRPRLSRFEVHAVTGADLPAVAIPASLLGQALLALIGGVAELTAPGTEIHVRSAAAEGDAEVAIRVGFTADGGDAPDLSVVLATAREAGGNLDVTHEAGRYQVTLRLPAEAREE